MDPHGKVSMPLVGTRTAMKHDELMFISAWRHRPSRAFAAPPRRRYSSARTHIVLYMEGGAVRPLGVLSPSWGPVFSLFCGPFVAFPEPAGSKYFLEGYAFVDL